MTHCFPCSFLICSWRNFPRLGRISWLWVTGWRTRRHYTGCGWCWWGQNTYTSHYMKSFIATTQAPDLAGYMKRVRLVIPDENRCYQCELLRWWHAWWAWRFVQVWNVNAAKNSSLSLDFTVNCDNCMVEFLALEMTAWDPHSKKSVCFFLQLSQWSLTSEHLFFVTVFPCPTRTKPAFHHWFPQKGAWTALKPPPTKKHIPKNNNKSRNISAPKLWFQPFVYFWRAFWTTYFRFQCFQASQSIVILQRTVSFFWTFWLCVIVPRLRILDGRSCWRFH